jgi:hypothetical protein
MVTPPAFNLASHGREAEENQNIIREVRAEMTTEHCQQVYRVPPGDVACRAQSPVIDIDGRIVIGVPPLRKKIPGRKRPGWSDRDMQPAS